LIKIYTKTTCPYCVKAKDWLKEHSYVYDEVLLDDDEQRQRFYVEHDIKSRTVPQIYRDGALIGGYSELVKSELAIKLDSSMGDF
jgi:glutaredoxin